MCLRFLKKSVLKLSDRAVYYTEIVAGVLTYTDGKLTDGTLTDGTLTDGTLSICEMNM